MRACGLRVRGPNPAFVAKTRKTRPYGRLSGSGGWIRLSRRTEGNHRPPGYEFESYLDISRPPNRARELTLCSLIPGARCTSIKHATDCTRVGSSCQTRSAHTRAGVAIVSPSRAWPVSPDGCNSYKDGQAHRSGENPPELERPAHEGFTGAATTYRDRWSNWHRSAGTLANPVLLPWILERYSSPLLRAYSS